MSGVWEKIAPSAVNSVRTGGIVKSSNILIPLTLWSLILIGLPAFVIQLSNSGRDKQEDFAVYYLEGEIINKGGNPYLTDLKSFSRTGPDTHGIVHGSDPPAFLVLCRGLAGLPIRSAYWIWQGFNFTCLVLVLLLLFSGSQIGLTWVLTFAGFAVLFPPVIVHFWFAQSKLPLAFMLLIVLHSMKSNRHSLAGLSLAISGLMRIFPLGIAGYLILQRRWSVIAYLAAGLLTGTLLTVAFIGLASSTAFLKSLSFLTGNLWKRDISIYSHIIGWLLVVYPLSISDIRKTGLTITVLVDASIILATTYATLRAKTEGDPEGRILSTWIAAVVLLQPIAWDYDLTLLLIPFGGLAVAAVHGRTSRRSVAMAISCYLLLMLWNAVPEPSVKLNPILRMAILNSGFLAMSAGYLSAYWFALDQPRTELSGNRAELYEGGGFRAPETPILRGFV